MTSELLQAARKARLKAYAPYSDFSVGCAVRSASGRVFTGVNVENASYGLTVCAERNAIFSMVAAGEYRFHVLLVAAGTDEPVPPCGACLQVMVEFALPDSYVIMAGLGDRVTEKPLIELLPLGFQFPLKGANQ
ncbi:MAG TPA: cytidine deaminase [Candidatus Aminicenantes bacterium]|nr:cytidine deaminase [Candidatus Aminicenantes bacterium]